jgi:adenylate cyclase class 2
MPDHETEIKLSVSNARAAKLRLAGLGFRKIEPRHFERNFLFDFPDLRLHKSSCVVRLRHEGKRSLLTFKGPPLRSSTYKIRREIETEVEDGHRFREILEALGLRAIFCYEKYRTTFADQKKTGARPVGLVVFDETPLGNFLELEGPKRWIDAVARQLGFRQEDYITASYVGLYFAKCEAEGKKAQNMVFGARQ